MGSSEAWRTTLPPGQRRDFGDRGDAGCLRAGAWILFSPAEAATWGGLPAILGYALGAAAPLLVFIPLGWRIRRMMPEGYTLTEYVFHRYGRGIYLFTLAVIPFYMFIFLAAEITSMALIANFVANVPLWITTLIVTGATLAHTTYWGLKASIFTDVIQIVVIVPLLAALLVGGLLFPDPAMTRGSLLGAFAAASAVSVAVSLTLTPRRSTFELHSLEENVRYIEV